MYIWFTFCKVEKSGVVTDLQEVWGYFDSSSYGRKYNYDFAVTKIKIGEGWHTVVDMTMGDDGKVQLLVLENGELARYFTNQTECSRPYEKVEQEPVDSKREDSKGGGLMMEAFHPNFFPLDIF